MSKLLIKKIVFLVQSWGGNSNRDEGGGDSEDAAGRYPAETAVLEPVGCPLWMHSQLLLV